MLLRLQWKASDEKLPRHGQRMHVAFRGGQYERSREANGRSSTRLPVSSYCSHFARRGYTYVVADTREPTLDVQRSLIVPLRPGHSAALDSVLTALSQAPSIADRL